MTADAKDASNPPVVAVACRASSSVAGATKNAHGVLATYVQAIEELGGAVALIALQRLDFAQQVLARCDGLLLAGGEDVVPSPGTVLPHGTTDELRDQVERALAGSAMANGVPILGICRGMHLLNVECGGTLGDIDVALANVVRHVNDWRAGEQYVHDVNLTPESRIGRAAKGRTTVRVNSHHRRRVVELGARLVATAHSDDGVVEAIERPGSYCVGVQWHPECLLEYSDDFARALLADFICSCREWRSQQ